MPETYIPIVSKGGSPQPPPPSSQRIVIDPLTRIEGHLRIEAKIEGGMITDAWSSGTAFMCAGTVTAMTPSMMGRSRGTPVVCATSFSSDFM